VTDTPSPAPSTNETGRFGRADEIEISTCLPDGTLRRFVPIWIVTVDGRLYVRSYRGGDGAWYRHATTASGASGTGSKKATGAIRADGRQLEVTFAPVNDAELLTAIGQAYQAKYGHTYLQPMLAAPAVAATVRLDPTT
jgi:hypothetical protein